MARYLFNDGRQWWLAYVKCARVNGRVAVTKIHLYIFFPDRERKWFKWVARRVYMGNHNQCIILVYVPHMDRLTRYQVVERGNSEAGFDESRFS
jgi:hypothetical protein